MAEEGVRGRSEDKTADEPRSLSDVDRDLRILIFGADCYAASLLPLGKSVTIGRSPEAQVRVDDPSISRLHASVHATQKDQVLEIVVEDLGSSNGTSVKGRRLGPGERCAISPGEIVDLGF